MERNKTITIMFKEEKQVLHVTKDEKDRLLSLEGDEQKKFLIDLWKRETLEESFKQWEKSINRMKKMLNH